VTVIIAATACHSQQYHHCTLLLMVLLLFNQPTFPSWHQIRPSHPFQQSRRDAEARCSYNCFLLSRQRHETTRKPSRMV